MSEIKPLIFKSFEDYYDHLYSLILEDGLYSFFVIVKNDDRFPSSVVSLAITSSYYEGYKHIKEYRDFHIAFCYSSEDQDDKFMYFCGDKLISAEEFFIKLSKSKPEHFKWLLFNPHWYSLGEGE